MSSTSRNDRQEALIAVAVVGEVTSGNDLAKQVRVGRDRAFDLGRGARDRIGSRRRFLGDTENVYLPPIIAHQQDMCR